MLYFTIHEQNNYSSDVRTYESTAHTNELSISVSKQLTRMYQYAIYEEDIDWSSLSEHMSEDVFNELFHKGQRLFSLESTHSKFIIKIEDYEKANLLYQKLQHAKQNKNLFEDLKIHCYNFVNNFITFEEFKEITNAYEDFEKDNDKKVFYLKIEKIENDIDIRREKTLSDSISNS